jgi:hypothetical protein
VGDPCLSVWLRRAHRCLSHAIGKAEVGSHITKRPGVSVSFDLGTTGEMRQSFLDSPEPNYLV